MPIHATATCRCAKTEPYRDVNTHADARAILSGMTQPDQSESLDWWLDWINVLIGTMEDAYLRGVVELDYSQASLQAMEDVARERYRHRYRLAMTYSGHAHGAARPQQYRYRRTS